MTGKIRYEQLDKTDITKNLATKEEIAEVNAKLSSVESGNLVIPTASEGTLGGIKVGDNLEIEADGTLNAQPGITVEDSAKNGNILVNKAEVNVYTHPDKHIPSEIATDVTQRFTSDAEINSKLDKTGGEVNGNLKVKQNLEVTGDILPTTNKTQSIGGPNNRFKSLYVDEAYLSTNTLYLGDTPVLGTDMDTINIKADPDQSIQMKTLGSGRSLITSQSGVDIKTDGINADVKIAAAGTGSKVDITSPNQVNITGTTGVKIIGDTTAGNLNVTGSLTVSGENFIVNSTTVTTKDNVIEINKGEVGAGVTAGTAGIRIDRGEVADYNIIFDEADDNLKAGIQGQEKILANQEWSNDKFAPKTHVGSGGNAHALANSNEAGFMSPQDKAKLDGISSGGSNVVASTTNGNIKIDGVETKVYTHPSTHPATMITEDTTHRFVTDADKAKWNGKADASSVYTKTETDSRIEAVIGSAPEALDTLTELANALGNDANFATTVTNQMGTKVDKVAGKGLSTEDYTTVEKGKLAGIEAGANKYVHPSSHPATMITEDTDHLFMTTTERNKLAGVATNANNYTHPSTHAATMITEDTTHRFVTDAEKATWNAKETTTGAQAKATTAETNAKTYTDGKIAELVDTAPDTLNTLNELAAALNDDPNFATSVATQIGEKVDKVVGKGLSTEDYTTTEKTKLAGITSGSNRVLKSTVNGNVLIDGTETNVYSHPSTHSADMIVDGTVNVSMTAAERSKLAGIAADANKYSHPTTHPASMITEDTTHRFVTDTEKATWNGKANTTTATTTTNGLLSSTDKAKLDGIAENAEVNQNTFANIKVGSTTISADSKSDTLELVAGTNITLTPDAANDKVTVAVSGIALTGHTHAFSELTSKPTTVAGYGITDTYTKTETDTRIQAVIGSAPEALDTLKELSSALNDDPNFASTVTTQLSNKVDKVTGKGLSTEDYTSAEKTKLAGVAANANNYVHPSTHAATMITEDATHRFVTDADKTIWNGKLDASATAVSASKLANARSIALGGDLSGSATFDGSANITISAQVANDSHTHTELSTKPDNFKDGLALPSEFPRGETIFFSNNPANKFNGVLYGTVQTIKGYNNMAAVQFLYPYNNDAPIQYRYALYNSDSWKEWRSLSVEGHTHAIADITNLQTTLNGKASTAVATTSANGLLSSADKTKLDGVAANANNYVHPSTHAATMITEDTTHRFVTDAEKATWNAKETTSGAQTKATTAETNAKAYADTKIAELVDTAPDTLNTLNELAAALNDDPNFATSITTQIGTKVDKVDGKGLSTEDYTSAEKTKLAGIATGANKYTHPSSHPATMITEDTTHRFVTDAEKATWNGKLDSSSNAVSASKWSTARTITLAGDLTGSVSIDGSANVTLTAAVADDSHNHTIANVDGLQSALNTKASIEYVDSKSLRGSGTFNSTTGVVITHNIGNTDYYVNVTPTSDSGGYLGEYWAVKDINTITVYCTGTTTTTTFDYMIQK